MPFDGATPKRTSEQQANLLELIHDLRNLPEDWEWDYGHCDTCALGRLFALHGEELFSHPGAGDYISLGKVSDFLGLKPFEAERAFIDAHWSMAPGATRNDVSPERVAHILEGCL